MDTDKGKNRSMTKNNENTDPHDCEREHHGLDEPTENDRGDAEEKLLDLSEEYPRDPTDLLPESSFLSLDDYLQMMRAVADPVGFRVTYRLLTSGEMTLDELGESGGGCIERVADAIERCVEVGIIERRLRVSGEDTTEYYRSTILGRVLLQRGILVLVQRELEFSDAYRSEEG